MPIPILGLAAAPPNSVQPEPLGVDAMFVCLCHGITGHEVAHAVQNGARTSKQVATFCGAGSDCGRCRATVRAIIASADLAPVASLLRPC